MQKKITKTGLFLMQNAPFSADDNPVIFFEPKALFVKKKKRKKADFFCRFLPFFTLKNPFFKKNFFFFLIYEKY
jgi:hypothetical protein